MTQLQIQTINKPFQASMKRFYTYTRIKEARLVTEFPNNMDPKRKQQILARKAMSWFNPRTETIDIYAPNISYSPEHPENTLNYIRANVLTESIYKYGMENLFNNKAAFDALMNKMPESIINEINPLSMHNFSNYLTTLLINRKESKKFATICDSITNFLFDDGKVKIDNFSYEKKFRPAILYGIKNGLKKSINTLIQKANIKDLEIEADDFNETLAYYKSIHLPVKMQNASEAMKSVGYPDVPLILFPEKIDSIIKQSNNLLTQELINQIPEQLSKPLAIFQNSHGNDNTSVYILLDIKYKDPKWGDMNLGFTLKSPERCVQTQLDTNKTHRDINLCPFVFSEKKIISLLSYKDNWMYMKPSENKFSQTRFELVDTLLKKSGGEISPALHPSGFDSHLLNVANIAYSFKNPIDNAQYFQLFGYERDPVRDAIIEKSKIQALLNEPVEIQNNKSQTIQARVPKESQYLTSEIGLTKTQLQNLRENNIKTAADILEAGFPRIREIVKNDKGLNSIGEWLMNNNIFIYPAQNNEVVPTLEGVNENFKQSISGMIPGHIHEYKYNNIPMDLEGNPFTTIDSISLLVSLDGKKKNGFRDTDCPYWISENEMNTYGLHLIKDMKPVPVYDDGNPRYLYNIAWTNFPKKYPEDMKKLLDGVKESNLEFSRASRFFSTLINNITGCDMKGLSNMPDYLHKKSKDFLENCQISKGPSFQNTLGRETIKTLERAGKIERTYKRLNEVNEQAKSLKKKN